MDAARASGLLKTFNIGARARIFIVSKFLLVGPPNGSQLTTTPQRLELSTMYSRARERYLLVSYLFSFQAQAYLTALFPEQSEILEFVLDSYEEFLVL